MFEADQRRIRHLACPFLLLGGIASVFTVYFTREYVNNNPNDLIFGSNCYYEGIDVADRFSLLLLFGIWTYALTAAICFLGFLTAALAKIGPTLAILSLHSVCTCLQLALFVNIGTWRFDYAGEFCSNDNLNVVYIKDFTQNEGTLYNTGLFLRNIFISMCFLTCLYCCTHYGHKHVRG